MFARLENDYCEDLGKFEHKTLLRLSYTLGTFAELNVNGIPLLWVHKNLF